MDSTNHAFFAPCPRGLEAVLASLQRGAEGLHLDAAVVDVELALHVVPGEGEEPRE